MRILLASLLFAGACSSAYAEQVAIPHPPGPRVALAVAPEKTRAPYDVQVIAENGDTAPTYAFKDRFYVQGNLNQRYTIRVTNPTASRVEAVVTVDGLDVVDGEAGDLRKRGYIVPAYGEVRIEGFRTSLADVATFRFSSVDNSYAGRKGKARNVGVIAVAIFEEQAAPPDQQIIAPEVTHRPYRWEDDVDYSASRPATRGDRGGKDVAKAEKKRVGAADKAAEPAEASRPAPAPRGGGVGGGGRVTATAPDAGAPARMRPPVEDEWEPPPVTREQTPRTNRLGLGTEFGEQRYSAASYTRFVRAANRPIAIAELRYNDQAGLLALGIPVAPMPDQGEIMMRETADPFPGDQFARPPVR
jgi:hypothetical protein